jgi:hypothetical protein
MEWSVLLLIASCAGEERPEPGPKTADHVFEWWRLRRGGLAKKGSPLGLLGGVAGEGVREADR